MSAIAVQEFFEKVQTDESLAQEFIKALEAEDDREAVAELAISKGYEITSDELWAEMQKRQAEFQQRQGAGELSDQELEAVVGGLFSGVYAAWIVDALKREMKNEAVPLHTVVVSNGQ